MKRFEDRACAEQAVSSQGSPGLVPGGTAELCVFSGTGNSLMIARALAEALRGEGVSANLRGMEVPLTSLDRGTVLGLVFPVACFSTYPTVWRFIRALPPGEGRDVFVAGTMGGYSGGMQAPMVEVLRAKGYRPVGARFFVMPGNYDNRTMPTERNAARVARAMEDVRQFAFELVRGEASVRGGIPLLSRFLYRLSQTRRPWDFFYRLYPITVDGERCVRCGWCAEHCPEGAIAMDPLPVVDPKVCQSCQRCVGFCPTGALHVPGKPAEPYRAMSREEFEHDLRGFG